MAKCKFKNRTLKEILNKVEANNVKGDNGK